MTNKLKWIDSQVAMELIRIELVFLKATGVNPMEATERTSLQEKCIDAMEFRRPSGLEEPLHDLPTVVACGLLPFLRHDSEVWRWR
jgi:hypothetical protein